MKRKLLLLLFFTSTIHAQEVKLLKNQLFKVNILNPGLSYEKRITNNTSLVLEANLSFGLNIHNDKKTILTTLYLKSQYRYYYNFQKRLDKNKSITNNSGNYLAFNAFHYFKPINNDAYISNLDGNTIGGVWGFQKTYKSKINLNSNLGIGYNISNNKSNSLVPLLNFTIGYVFGN